MKKESDHPILLETNYGLKGSILSIRPSKTNPSSRFTLYIPKEEDATSIRVPFLIILLGVIFTATNSFLVQELNDSFFFFFEIVEQGTLVSLPLLSIFVLISTILLENLASFQLANILGSWFISGFLIGLIYGRTNYEGILVLTLKALVYLFSFLFMFSISFYYFILSRVDGIQDRFFIELGFFIVVPFILLFFLLLLIPLSFVSSLGHYVGVKLNNE